MLIENIMYEDHRSSGLRPRCEVLLFSVDGHKALKILPLLISDENYDFVDCRYFIGLHDTQQRQETHQRLMNKFQ